MHQEKESLTVPPVSYRFSFNSRFSTELRIVSRFSLIEMRKWRLLLDPSKTKFEVVFGAVVVVVVVVVVVSEVVSELLSSFRVILSESLSFIMRLSLSSS